MAASDSSASENLRQSIYTHLKVITFIYGLNIEYWCVVRCSAGQTSSTAKCYEPKSHYNTYRAYENRLKDPSLPRPEWKGP